jgi:hypothetical protein
MLKITVDNRSISATEFKALMSGPRVEGLGEIQIQQDGISGVVSTMYVGIYPGMTGEDKYYISISGGGFSARRVAAWADIYKTLLDGYGLWSL